MQVLSTNIGKATTVSNKKRSFQTGIYKTSVDGISLGKTDVVGDHVMDRKHHGGIDKACYMYSADLYPFWKKKFPDLEWSNGMFGENLTVSGYNDSKVYIGDTYKIGSALVQVSEPRRPCSILGIRFGTKDMVKLFNNSEAPGAYLRVLEKGDVHAGDCFELIARESDFSVRTIFSLFSSKDKELALKALDSPFLADDCKNSIRKRFNI